MHDGILPQLLILLAASLPLSVLLRRIGQSTILGYLLTGLAIGPAGLNLIQQGAIEILAEIGVALLLFTIGIELTFGGLGRARRIGLIGGPIQIGLTIAAMLLVAHYRGRTLYEGAYVGCAVALSSSAIVLKTLADRGELDAPHAGGVIAISIFQDLATVPMLVLLPALHAGGTGAQAGGLLIPISIALGKATLVLGGMWIGSRFFIGPLLHFVARARSPEIFVITVMTLVLAAAWGAAAVGLSLAIGAFIAGILLAESEYAHQIMGDMLPFKDVFQSIFFVSVGMLLDPSWVAAHPGLVAIAVAAVVGGKAIIIAVSARVAGAPARTAAKIGIALAQVGEFSFVLMTLGARSRLFSEEIYQLTLSASVVSMAIAPPLIANARRIVDVMSWIPGLSLAVTNRTEPGLRLKLSPRRDHVVIGGFGPVGRDVAQFLLDNGIDFVALEVNPRTVREFKDKGIEIYFGDVANPVVLHEAGIERARALVLAMPDVIGARRAVQQARRMNPKIAIVTRTKYRSDVESFMKEGADEVVEEEFETALEMVVRLMTTLEIPRRVIAERMAGQRLERYRMKPANERMRVAEGGPLPTFDIEMVRARAGSELLGRTIGDCGIRSRTGVTILAIIREQKVHMNPGPDFDVQLYDRLACVGTGKQLEDFAKLANPGGETTGRYRKVSGP